MSNEIESAQMAGVEAGQDFAIFQNKGYQGLYGGLGVKEIHSLGHLWNIVLDSNSRIRWNVLIIQYLIHIFHGIFPCTEFILRCMAMHSFINIVFDFHSDCILLYA